jgi:apolipoprotein N-acyltransferase
LFTQRFIKDSLERGVSTFAQAWAAAMAVPGPDWGDSLKIAGVAALVAIAKAVAATRVGDPETAAMGKS